MSSKSRSTIEAPKADTPLSTSPARALPEHTMDHADNKRDIKANKSGGATLRPKDEAPKQAFGKRTHSESDASSAGPSGAAVVPANKRVRPTTAPRATSNTTPGGQAGNSGHMDFSAAMFTCQLGKDGPELKAHEFTLKRSPVFVQEIRKARANKRVAKHDTLFLMAHDRTAFEQMLNYLYTDKFQMSKNKSTTKARLDELKELMSLAKHYKLPDLQKQVVQVFKTSKLVTQIPLAKFFDWAEDMYYEELDHKNGPFKVYFSKVAPDLLKGMDEACKRSLAAMVNQGGGYAEQLFIAATTALDLQTSLNAIKKEEEVPQNPGLPPHRTTKGKDKESIFRTALGETSYAPKDENMEHDGFLFVRN